MINSMMSGLPDPDEALTYEEVVKFLNFRGTGSNRDVSYPPRTPQENLIFSMLKMKIENNFEGGYLNPNLQYFYEALDTPKASGIGDKVPTEIKSKMKSILADLKEKGIKNPEGVSGNTVFQSPHAFKESPQKCNSCGKSENLLRCTRCEEAYYCGRECQKQDWRDHKHSCVSKKPTF